MFIRVYRMAPPTPTSIIDYFSSVFFVLFSVFIRNIKLSTTNAICIYMWCIIYSILMAATTKNSIITVNSLIAVLINNSKWITSFFRRTICSVCQEWFSLSVFGYIFNDIKWRFRLYPNQQHEYSLYHLIMTCRPIDKIITVARVFGIGICVCVRDVLLCMCAKKNYNKCKVAGQLWVLFLFADWLCVWLRTETKRKICCTYTFLSSSHRFLQLLFFVFDEIIYFSQLIVR